MFPCVRVTRSILVLRTPSRCDGPFNPGRMDALQEQTGVVLLNLSQMAPSLRRNDEWWRLVGVAAEKKAARSAAFSHRQGAPRLTPATPDSSAARTPTDPATAHPPQSPPAPAAAWPDPSPSPRRPPPRPASAAHAADLSPASAFCPACPVRL